MGDAGTDAGTDAGSDAGIGNTLDTAPISASVAAKDEFETHLAVAPNGTIGVSWTEEAISGPFPIGYAFSKDGGKTWTAPKRIFSLDGGRAADSVLVTDAQSVFLLVWIGDAAVYAARQQADGSFGTPVEISDPAAGHTYDKPWAVQTGGKFLVTYQEQTADTTNGDASDLDRGVAAVSTDGQHWTRNVMTEEDAGRNLYYPCTSPNADRVWVVFHNIDGTIGMRWSTTNGTQWTTSDLIVSDHETDIPFSEPECVANNDEVWLIYGESDDDPANGMNSKHTTLHLAHSKAGAAVDYRSVKSHDTADEKFYLQPQLGRSPDGTLDLTYYAGRADNDALGSFRWARSTDGGKTFAKSVTVREPVVFTQDRPTSQWPGDYSGLGYWNGAVVMSYIDNAIGASHVAFARR